MLTVVSDFHLTDGTSGETINPGAFEIFADQILDLAKKREAKSFQLVLLGDIFDVIRSEKWDEVEVRPWDNKSDEQEDILLKILEDILKHNEEGIEHLRNLLSQMKEENGIESSPIEYRMGNHDWLINRYQSARKMTRAALGLGGDGEFGWMPLEDKNHRVVMRHGDRYDPTNYMNKKGRDGSSLGDAVVIELLNKFPLKCAEALDLEKNDPEIQRLRNIDNVRPYGLIPSWVMSVTNQMSDGKAQKVRDVFAELFDGFVKNKFVKSFDTWNPLDMIDVMEFGAGLLRMTNLDLSVLETIGAMFPVESKIGVENRYVQGAIRDLRRSNNVNYVVFGHTHHYLLLPLDRRMVSGLPDAETIYFNSGTWRKRFERTIVNPKEHEFIGHHVMTHVNFYSNKDNTERNYEVWHAALGE